MFQYLYVQTEYSILQSVCKIVPLVKKLKKDNILASAIVDEGSMYGTIQFYKECKNNNIKPIIGLKINYTNNDQVNSIILLAMNTFGYRNLMRISSRYKINNNIIDLEYLQKAKTGLLAIIPFEESNIKNDVNNNDFTKARNNIDLLCEIFDITYIGIGIETINNPHYISKVLPYFFENQYKMVALPKVSFIEKEDYDAYVTLKSIKNNCNLVELPNNEQLHYIYTQDQISKIYYRYPSLVEETNNIAKMCNVKIEFGKYQLPLYKEGLDSKEYLAKLSLKGLQRRIQQLTYSVNEQIYHDRLNYELSVITKMGFCDYFLIVYDYVNYAKKNGIFVGPGRGSAPASIVAYSLGITDIDPIYHNLLFERFLNKERVSMPDIDIDFPDDRREEVIKYVGQKYGKSRVAHIVTFGTFKMKLAINECAKVYKLSEIKLKEINKYLQNSSNYKSHENPSLQEIVENSEELNVLMDDHEDIKKVLINAIKIQDIPRNISTHAAGIVITKFDLINYTPLDKGLDDIYQTQYEASDLESLGLLKMDFLGLKNLTNIAKTIELIKKDIPNFKLPKDNLDSKTYEMMRNGDLAGVFQLESSGMKQVIMKLGTSKFDDITHALALYRPGPKDIINSFIKRKFKQEQVEYLHEDLKEILEETYGTIVYQEQIILIACKFAGYSLGKADILRRAVSKKNKDVLEKERTEFVNSSVNNGYSKNIANVIYDYIVKFADYGFNKPHSVAYAKLSYLTAYLKCHYFAYYMSTLMTSVLGSSSDILEYTKDAAKRNIMVHSPDVNKSNTEFQVVDNQIYFPLTSIKGLGEIKSNQLLQERKNGEFLNFEDFVSRTKNILSESLIEYFIYSSALDSFGLTKKSMITTYKSLINRDNYGFVKDMIGINYTDEEYSYGMLQEKEHEAIGVNLKYNFFRQFSTIYQKYQLIKICDVVENQYVKTIGIIKSIKEVKTKQNEIMAFVEIVDDTSSLELVFFPRSYQINTKLIPGMIMMVKGKIQRRTNLQLVVEQIRIVS